jgi:FMN phosphatase YigB (HAD superfamily)
LDRHFGRLFISSDSGLRKPDREAFSQAVAAWGGPPASIAFVDDKLENVDAAAAVGMHGIHSTVGPADWERKVMAWLAGGSPDLRDEQPIA